jgi:DNA repair ATPase RecN
MLSFLVFLVSVLVAPQNHAYILYSRVHVWNSHRPPSFARGRSLVQQRVSTQKRTDIGQVSEKERSENVDISYIASIRSYNLAGTISEEDGGVISISFGHCPNLVAVTGETGSGKSLLIAKAAELLSGGKVISPSLVSQTTGGQNTTFVEMEICLSPPHISVVQQSLRMIGLDPAILFQDSPSTKRLILKRELAVVEERIKSTCWVNGITVSLKALRCVSRPLLAIVDAAAAAAALAKQNSRLSIIDTAVPPPILSYARLTRAEYRKCLGYRQRLENELSNRMLPVSMSDNKDDDRDLELLQHWIDELDAFEERVAKFCGALGGHSTPGSNLDTAAERLMSTAWFDDSDNSDGSSDEKIFSSTMYNNLLEFREAVKTAEEQLDAARHARDTLSSLSSPDSAITALERTRKYLFDATVGESEKSRLSSAAEKAHDMLNNIEQALKACTASLEAENIGLVTLLESTRRSLQVTTEDIDIIVGDWNTLARKHGMSPFSLPACHRALRSELDGNLEARLLLPEAVTAELRALERFHAACSMLSDAREKVTKQLSLAVDLRLPSLGMEGSSFSATLRVARNCTDVSAYAANAMLGIDSVDFLLLHAASDEELGEKATSATGKFARTINRGGKIDVVASSGEKARILLAIECELPGSIGAASRALSLNHTDIDLAVDQIDPAPVAVIYDEIDAHVGGRAAVAMAAMLADQACERASSMTKGQVVSITHSPSLAAIADRHILIRSSRIGLEGKVKIEASVIDGAERRKELARMASGDLATDEAEIFADALLRDGIKRRQSNDDSSK